MESVAGTLERLFFTLVSLFLSSKGFLQVIQTVHLLADGLVALTLFSLHTGESAKVTLQLTTFGHLRTKRFVELTHIAGAAGCNRHALFAGSRLIELLGAPLQNVVGGLQFLIELGVAVLKLLRPHILDGGGLLGNKPFATVFTCITNTQVAHGRISVRLGLLSLLVLLNRIGLLGSKIVNRSLGNLLLGFLRCPLKLGDSSVELATECFGATLPLLSGKLSVLLSDLSCCAAFYSIHFERALLLAWPKYHFTS